MTEASMMTLMTMTATTLAKTRMTMMATTAYPCRREEGDPKYLQSSRAVSIVQIPQYWFHFVIVHIQETIFQWCIKTTGQGWNRGSRCGCLLFLFQILSTPSLIIDIPWLRREQNLEAFVDPDHPQHDNIIAGSIIHHMCGGAPFAQDRCQQTLYHTLGQIEFQEIIDGSSSCWSL
jgi:hypothetical protein